MSDTATPKNYKLLIHAILEQQGSFSTGGNRFQERDANLDHVIAKNGEGEYTLRGTGLAGAFIATACQLYNTLPGEISEQSPLEYHKKMKRKFERENSDKKITYEQWLAKQPRMPESLWLFHHAHPLNKPEHSEIRDNVAIRQKTGAAKDGAKFDAETLPAGTQWSFLMEVDQYRDIDNNNNNSVNADSIALNTLQHWQDHGCWLGKDVARGLGYMKLKQINIYQLTTDHIDRWPDSGKTPCEPLQGLSSMTLNEDEQTELKNQCKPDQKPCIASGSITIQVGQDAQGTDSYGLDMLSVGGNNGKKQEDKNSGKVIDYPKEMQGKAFLEQRKNKLITPLGQKQDTYFEFQDKDIDFHIAVTRKNGTYIPHIPGSAMRGPLRHSLSWLLRKQDNPVWEPAGENEHPASGEEDIVLKLYGSTQRSTSLLISDALPVDDDWLMLVLEMHAEDEFTQGVYCSSKFDRTCLTKGTFKAHFELQANNEEELIAMTTELEKLQTLGKNQFIPIGGGQWKGLGWVKLAIEFAHAEAETDTRDETAAGAVA